MLKLSPRQQFTAVFLSAAVLVTACAAQRTASAPGTPVSKSVSTQQKFEAFASKLDFFDLEPFLVNSRNLDFEPAQEAERTRYFQLLDQILDPKVPATELSPLLHHANPRVRTLALAALFHRNDPRFLPSIVHLAKDKTPTFPSYKTLSKRWLSMTGIGPPTEKQTVGDVANAMANFYLKRAEFDWGIAGTRDTPGFASYWAQRKHRKYCASWFAVQLARAPRDETPAQAQYRNAIRLIRKRIDALPANDRDWTLLALGGVFAQSFRDGDELLATDAELVEAAKRRGPDALLALLQQKSPSQDPDIQPRTHDSSYYEQIMAWTLRHASQVLRPEMADALLRCEQQQRTIEKRTGDAFVTTGWATAAAQLQPRRGRTILKKAWTRFNREYEGAERISLMAALTEIGDPQDYTYIANWFFAPPPAHFDSTDQVGKQAQFFRDIPRQEASRATRQLVARLIRDARFNTASYWAHDEAAELAKVWQGKPIIDRQKFYEASWLGRSNTRASAAAMATTREALRRTSSQWANAPKMH